MMNLQVKKESIEESGQAPTVGVMMENVLACKWYIHVLQLVHRGVQRPGAMQRAVDGLSTKVLNERLRALVRFGILSRVQYAEVPPRVEYHFTEFGRQFARIVDDINALQRSLR